MTDYNNGEWHGWNGGECPVHPETVVEISGSGYTSSERTAERVDWNADVIVFRVIKEHKEPREFWIAERYIGDDMRVLDAEPDNDDYYRHVIHVREVME